MKKDPFKGEHNTLCQRCLKECKQPAYVKLLKCPKYEPASLQLEIPLFKKTYKKHKAT